MNALTIVGASHAFAAPHSSPRSRLPVADVVALHADARPNRIGGAPLAGARATDAYQLTAAVDSLNVLSRIDEYA